MTLREDSHQEMLALGLDLRMWSTGDRCVKSMTTALLGTPRLSPYPGSGRHFPVLGWQSEGPGAWCWMETLSCPSCTEPEGSRGTGAGRWLEVTQGPHKAGWSS